MASLSVLVAAAEESLSGQSVRGAVEGAGNVGSAGSVGSKAAAAGTQAVSTLGQTSIDWSSYIQAVGILFLLLAILWLAVWLLRRFGRFNFLPRNDALPRNALVMEAQLPLGPRKGLMVVRFLNKRLLLGVTDQQITLLTEEHAQNEETKNGFQQIMEDASRHSDGS